MRRTSLVQAKTHLSDLVDRAERKGQLTLICRHGRPAAAIVPVDVAARAAERARLSPEDAIALLARMAARSQSQMSLDEALGRDRLDQVR